MNLHIDSAEAHRLALELARRTGDSVADAVTKAIKAELCRQEEIEAKRKRIDAILERSAEAGKNGPGSADIDALLYDEETGLPK